MKIYIRCSDCHHKTNDQTGWPPCPKCGSHTLDMTVNSVPAWWSKDDDNYCGRRKVVIGHGHYELCGDRLTPGGERLQCPACMQAQK